MYKNKKRFLKAVDSNKYIRIIFDEPKYGEYTGCLADATVLVTLQSISLRSKSLKGVPVRAVLSLINIKIRLY